MAAGGYTPTEVGGLLEELHDDGLTAQQAKEAGYSAAQVSLALTLTLHPHPHPHPNPNPHPNPDPNPRHRRPRALPERQPAVHAMARRGVRRPGGGGSIYGEPAAISASDGAAWRGVRRGGRLLFGHVVPAGSGLRRCHLRRRRTGCRHERRGDGRHGWRAALGAVVAAVGTPRSPASRPVVRGAGVAGVRVRVTPRSPDGAREPCRLVGHTCEALRRHRSTVRRAVLAAAEPRQVAGHHLHLMPAPHERSAWRLWPLAAMQPKT